MDRRKGTRNLFGYRRCVGSLQNADGAGNVRQSVISGFTFDGKHAFVLHFIQSIEKRLDSDFAGAEEDFFSPFEARLL